jgi:palmitoyltransferase ZDHHC13/17
VSALHEANLRLLALTQPSPQRNSKFAIFFMPSIFLYLMFATLTILPWYTGIILAMAEFFGMHHVGFLLPMHDNA